MLDTLCPPAILYLGFSLTQIIIDTFKGHYNTAFFKTIVMCIFTLLLNILCSRGLSVISWLIVFIPFILMTYITAVLLFVFGLSPSNGSANSNSNLQYNVKYPSDYPNEMLIARNPQHNEMMDDIEFDFTNPSLPPQVLTTQSSLQSQIITPPTQQLPAVTSPDVKSPTATPPTVQAPAPTQPSLNTPPLPPVPPVPPVPPQYSQYSQYSQYLQQMI
jgi:hypothetical protein